MGLQSTTLATSTIYGVVYGFVTSMVRAVGFAYKQFFRPTANLVHPGLVYNTS